MGAALSYWYGTEPTENSPLTVTNNTDTTNPSLCNTHIGVSGTSNDDGTRQMYNGVSGISNGTSNPIQNSELVTGTSNQ